MAKDEEFNARRDLIDRFGDALERTITLARFIVARSDQSTERELTRLDYAVYPLVRRAFIQTDLAAHAAGFGWPGSSRERSCESDETIDWVEYVDIRNTHYKDDIFGVGAAEAGYDLYRRTLAISWMRWRCTDAMFEDEGKKNWIGKVYPKDFPRYEDVIMPSDLERLRDALSLVRLAPAVARPEPPSRPPDVPAETQKALLKRLNFKSHSYKQALTDAQKRGDILLMPAGGGKRMLWNMWILKPDKYPPPGD